MEKGHQYSCFFLVLSHQFFFSLNLAWNKGVKDVEREVGLKRQVQLRDCQRERKREEPYSLFSCNPNFSGPFWGGNENL